MMSYYDLWVLAGARAVWLLWMLKDEGGQTADEDEPDA